MKVKDGKGDEYDAICKKPFRINSGNITLDYLGGSCPFEINTNPERWNTIKPGRSFLLSITLNDMYAFIPGDNYYFISPVGSTSTLYWDVNNNYDLEDNLVKLYPRTGYDTAQTWKVVMQDNGSVVLIPMISLTRGLTFKNSTSVLSSSYDYWYLEKVN